MLWVGDGRGESHHHSHVRDREMGAGRDPITGSMAARARHATLGCPSGFPEAQKLQLGSKSQPTDERKRASSVLTVPRKAMPVPKLTAAGITPNFPA